MTIPVTIYHNLTSDFYSDFGQRVGVIAASIAPLPVLLMYWSVPQWGRKAELEELYALVFELDTTFRRYIKLYADVFTFFVLVLATAASAGVSYVFVGVQKAEPMVGALLTVGWTVTIFTALMGLLGLHITCLFHRRARDVLLQRMEKETSKGEEPKELDVLLDDHIDLSERLRRTGAAWNLTISVSVFVEGFATLSYALTYLLDPGVGSISYLCFALAVFLLLIVMLLNAAAVTAKEEKMFRSAKAWYANCSMVSNDPTSPNYFMAEYFLSTISVYPSSFNILGNPVDVGMITDIVLYMGILAFTIVVVAVPNGSSA